MVAFRPRDFSFTETSQITDLSGVGNSRFIDSSACILIGQQLSSTTIGVAFTYESVTPILHGYAPSVNNKWC
jgi:hypothetical protein